MTVFKDKNGNEISAEHFFKDMKPSPPAKGKQKIMENYTKLVMKRLYGEDILVFFYTTYDLSVADLMPYRGIFRDAEMGPFLIRDTKVWLKNPICSVTYDGLLYTPDSLPGHAWQTIVHEVTHFEIGMEGYYDPDEYYELRHPKKFKEIFEKNLRKVDDLRKEFNKEVGWNEDFVYRDEEDE